MIGLHTLEPNKPRFTLLKLHNGDIQIMTHARRPILTTDQDSLIQYAAMRAKMNPSATYFISRVNTIMEM